MSLITLRDQTTDFSYIFRAGFLAIIASRSTNSFVSKKGLYINRHRSSSWATFSGLQCIWDSKVRVWVHRLTTVTTKVSSHRRTFIVAKGTQESASAILFLVKESLKIWVSSLLHLCCAVQQQRERERDGASVRPIS